MVGHTPVINIKAGVGAYHVPRRMLSVGQTPLDPGSHRGRARHGSGPRAYLTPVAILQTRLRTGSDG